MNKFKFVALTLFFILIFSVSAVAVINKNQHIVLSKRTVQLSPTAKNYVASSPNPLKVNENLKLSWDIVIPFKYQ